MKNKIGFILTALWLLTMAGSLALSAWIIYVIYHFVVKFW